MSLRLMDATLVLDKCVRRLTHCDTMDPAGRVNLAIVRGSCLKIYAKSKSPGPE